ncbi:MAG TPA: response regulator, partial [Bacteroidales bacterium]|nr:response regulator [Bacteroidales bacterium]
MALILVVDDERAIRNSLKDILEFESYTVLLAENGKNALELLQNNKVDLVFSDIKMPEMDGIEFLKLATEIRGDIPIVMISGHGTIDIAVDAIKHGAFDFIAKPLDLNRILITVKNALEKTELVQETTKLRKKILSKYEMIGESSSMLNIKNIIA